MRIPSFPALVLGLTACSLHAQIWPEVVSERQFWDGGNLITVSANDREVRIEGPGLPKQGRLHPLPDGLRYLSFTDGTHHAMRREQGPSGRTCAIFSSPDAKTWTPVGHIPGDVTGFVPLRNGRYFACVALRPLTDGRSGSHMALFRQSEKGGLRLEALVAFPFSEPLCRPTGKRNPDGQPSFTIPDKWSVVHQTFFEPPVVLQDHLCLYNRQTGWVLVFSREDGSLKRTVKVYAGVDETRIQRDGSKLEVGLLCLQATREGSLLIASRMEDAVLHSRSLFASNPDKLLPGQAPFEAEQAFIPDQRNSVKAWPDILYWRLDPETGDLRPEAPPNLPLKIHRLEDLKRFRFRMRIDNTPTLH